MRNKITLADYLIELSASAVVIGLYAFGIISLAVAILGLVLCLSISLPYRRKSNSGIRNVPPTSKD